MNRLFSVTFLLFTTVFFFGCPQPKAPTPKPGGEIPATSQADLMLKFGLYASDQADTVIGEHRPTLDVLEKVLQARLGKSVAIHTMLASSYEEGVNQIAEGKVDFTKLGPASYVLAREKEPGLSILATEAKDEKKRFKGIIAVHENSNITSLRDLKGKSFAFGDKQSTIGRFLSQKVMSEAGLHSEDLGNFEYLGRHDLVGEAVGNKDFDAGALKESTFKKQVAAGVPIRKLVEFDNITKPWVARVGLDKDVASALREGLLNLKDEKALEALGKDGLVEATPEEYDFISESMKASEAFIEPRPTDPDLKNAGTPTPDSEVPSQP